jgi:hypothetical protein
MPVYNVYLVDVAPAVGPRIDRRLVAAELEDLFRAVVRGGGGLHGCGFGDAHVEWVPGCPALRPWELVIYFVPNQFEDVASRVAGGFAFDPELAGFTGLGARHVSEVFRDAGGAVFLAKTAFHEAMHNKLRMGEKELHTHDGLARARISERTPLTSGNIRLMAPALRAPRPQWCLGQADWRALDSSVIPDLGGIP